MTVVEPGGAQGIVDRVKNILTQPRAEWGRIANEQTPLAALLGGYVLPLAAIAALCSLIGLSVFGVGAFGYTYRVPLMSSAFSAVSQLVLTLACVWVLGLIVNALASTFGATQDQTRANQLVAYSSTAGLVGAFAMIFPALGIVALIGGIYSLVLLYLGLPPMMKTPQDKRAPYFIAIIVAAIVTGIVGGAIYGAVTNLVAPRIGAPGGVGAMFGRAPEQQRGTITVPGGGQIDVSELERAAKQMEAMAANPQAAAGAAALTADQLRALLPESLAGGFARTEISTGSTGMMMGLANATAIYQNGDARIELSITDLGAAGAMAAAAGAFGAQGSRETADGYERAGPVDGRLTIEEVDRTSRTAKYGVVAGQRIMIQADGANVDINAVRAAVNAVGVARVEAMAARPPG